MTNELSKKLLDQAEEFIDAPDAHESLLDRLKEAETLFPDDVSVFCRSAKMLFRYGVLNGKGRFYLLALNKLSVAEEKDPLFFRTHPSWWQLWGNLLAQLGRLTHQGAFFAMALDKYKKASQYSSDQSTYELYWDWAESWTLLGQMSQEVTDFQQSLEKFQIALHLNPKSPFFYLDHACALVLYGKALGNPTHVEEAVSILQKVIADTCPIKDEPSIAHLAAWKKLCLAAKVLYQLTHRQEDFEQADLFFREAILTSAKNGELWLDWGELFLCAGWLKRNFKLVELGLEKLTSPKIKECDPLKTSYLLGKGLVIFGLFLESLKLLKDGQERIRTAHQLVPDQPQLIFACGFSELGLGLYFSDSEALARAASIFEKNIQEDAASVDNLHALFQTYMAWGMQKGDALLVQKGIKAIARLCEIVPCSHVYLNEWGVSLLRLNQLGFSKEKSQAYLEEAIDKFRKSWELYEEDEALYNWGCALDLLGDITADEEDYAKAIDLLTKVFEKKPSELHVRYHLGLAFSHLGELTLNADCLTQAIELLELLANIDLDDENVWCELGYALLNLSELISDSLYPEEGERKRREAERVLLRAAELGSPDACYHLACLYSLAGLYEASMHYLRRTEAAKHLPSLEDLEQDEWLEGVRTTEAFQAFLTSQGENG